MEVIEANIDMRGHCRRHEIGCRVADIDRGHLQCGGLERDGAYMKTDSDLSGIARINARTAEKKREAGR